MLMKHEPCPDSWGKVLWQVSLDDKISASLNKDGQMSSKLTDYSTVEISSK